MYKSITEFGSFFIHFEHYTFSYQQYLQQTIFSYANPLLILGTEKRSNKEGNLLRTHIKWSLFQGPRPYQVIPHLDQTNHGLAYLYVFCNDVN